MKHEDKGKLDLGSGSVSHTITDHSKSKKNSLVAGSVCGSANSEALGSFLLTGKKDEFLRLALGKMISFDMNPSNKALKELYT